MASSLGAIVAVLRIQTMPAIPGSESWIQYMLVNQSGICAFLLMGPIIFIAATALMVAQTGLQFYGCLEHLNDLPATFISVCCLLYVLEDLLSLSLWTFANASRYKYLRGPDGRFRNPCNHGCWKNCTDLL